MIRRVIHGVIRGVIGRMIRGVIGRVIHGVIGGVIRRVIRGVIHGMICGVIGGGDWRGDSQHDSRGDWRGDWRGDSRGDSRGERLTLDVEMGVAGGDGSVARRVDDTGVVVIVAQLHAADGEASSLRVHHEARVQRLSSCARCTTLTGTR